MSIKKFLEDGKDCPPGNPVAGGGGPPYDGEMEARIARLEEFVVEERTGLRAIDVRLGKIEVRLDVTATKADRQPGQCERDDQVDRCDGRLTWCSSDYSDFVCSECRHSQSNSSRAIANRYNRPRSATGASCTGSVAGKIMRSIRPRRQPAP